jgi:peptide/nickel transport system substrate-binding protein
LRSCRRGGWSLLITGALLVGACSSAPVDQSSQGTIAPAGQEHGRATVDEGEPHRGGDLVVGVMADADGYHPIKNNWTTEGHLVGSAIIEPLMAYGPDGKLQPWLAESVIPNQDMTVWTVKVRSGITFHDGTPLNAEAVRANLQAAMFEGLASIAFEGIVDSVDVVDTLTVQIHLTSAYAVIPEVLAGVAGYVSAPSMLENPDGARHPVGTGPFIFQDWTPGASLRATANPDYWRKDEAGRKLPYLESIEFRFILDDTTRFAALQAGDVDLIMTTHAQDIAAARDRPDFVEVEDNLSEETFVMLNEGAPPFNNVHAREAIAYGTNPDDVVAVTQGGQALVATSPFAPGTDWAVSDPGWVHFDPDRARQAAEAYQQDTGQPLMFKLSGIPTDDSLQVLQTLQQQWAEVGIHSDIETLEPVAYIVGVTSSDYQAAWFRNYSYHDPLYLYPFFHSKFAKGAGTLSTNFSQVHNTELDGLLERGLATSDMAERHRLNEQAVQQINRELVDVWLFHTPYALIGHNVAGLNHPRVVGFANLEPKPWVGGLWITSS